MPSLAPVLRLALAASLSLLPTTHAKPSLAAAPGYSPFAPDFQRGIVFGGDEWSSPVYPYGSEGAHAALRALAATGASHVRLLVSGYMDNAFTATRVYSIAPPSALATTSVEALQATLAQAVALGLAPVLCPVLDPNWDTLPPGARSTINNPNGTWRGTIGSNYTTQAEYDAFFASYRAWAWPYFQAAAAAGAAMIEVSSELDFLFGAPLAAPAWRALVADLRALPFAGKLSVAADLAAASSMQWADALDYVGLDVYAGLGAPLPLGQAPSVADLVAGFEAAVTPQLLALAARNLSLIISETGFQARPNCHVRPWGTELLDPDDDSAWLLVVDTTCQDHAYEALFRYAASKPYLHGLYLWLWRSDPTTGGTYNGDFTPYAKPAEATLRRWYGGAVGGNSSTAALLAARAAAAREPTPQQRARALAGIVPPSPQHSLARFHAPHPRTRRAFNGWCLGTPDEWSSPFYRLGSAGSLASLDDMVASTGADAVEVIAQWWFDDVNSTEIYPIADAGSPLATSTDAELGAYVAAARARGLKTVFTLMLDPNWLLPAQAHCRDTGRAGCHWRGEVGRAWGSDCSEGSAWAAWHANYARATLHYAALAAAWGVDSLLLAHELYGPNAQCPGLWGALLAGVRGVFNGSVSSVVQVGDSPARLGPWVADLDYLGIDCYQSIGLPPAAVPREPWADASLSDLVAAAQATMPAFAATSAAFGGKAIVCTELGMPSRPHAYTTWGGALLLDPEDCSVWDQVRAGGGAGGKSGGGCLRARAHTRAPLSHTHTHTHTPPLPSA